MKLIRMPRDKGTDMNCFYETEQTQFFLTPGDIPNQGILFVDHQKQNRGGHFGHALVEYADGKILDFYPNCNTDNGGHSGRGWMEWKRSEDGGETWSEGKAFPYSKNLYDLNIGITSINEKAVLTDDGQVLLFNLLCDVSENALWEPYLAPTYLMSSDGGETWGEPRRFTRLHGRVYDAVKREGTIYILFCACYNENPEDNGFRLFCSEDNGARFYERSRLPFLPDRFYGSLEWLPTGELIAYTYTEANEYCIEYAVSENQGKVWSPVQTTFFAKRIRNPQIVRFCDAYFAFGRSGHFGENPGNLVLYCSQDGLRWDEGRYLAVRTAGHGAYSNALVTGLLNPAKKPRMLYQASHAYYLHQTNVLHWWIDAKKKGEDSIYAGNG